MKTKAVGLELWIDFKLQTRVVYPTIKKALEATNWLCKQHNYDGAFYYIEKEINKRNCPRVTYESGDRSFNITLTKFKE